MDTPGLIWTDGRIVRADAPALARNDRALQHGLGLFETLRVQDGRAPLLDRHWARLVGSAAALGLAVPTNGRPTPADVAALVRACGLTGVARLRLTLSGGAGPDLPGCLWLEAGPLPASTPDRGQILLRGPTPEAATWLVDPDDRLARHKTLNYWSKRLAHDAAEALGNTESLSRTPDGSLWEGSRTNLFAVEAGTLVTPPASGPLLPGILRGLLLERAGELGLTVVERGIGLDDLRRADEAFLTNALRGILPVAAVRDTDKPAPGPVTTRLRRALDAWLRPGA